MGPNDVRDLWYRRRGTDNGSRSGTQRGEDGGGHRRVPLVSGMEPVGTAEITRPTVLGVEFVDRVEAIQADERPAVPHAHLLDDRVEAPGRRPGPVGEHARGGHG